MKKFHQNINKKLEEFLNSHSTDELTEIFAELYKDHLEGLTINEYLDRTEYFYSELYKIETNSEPTYLSQMQFINDQEEIEFYKAEKDILIEFTDNIELSGESIEVETDDNYYNPDNEPDYKLAA